MGNRATIQRLKPQTTASQAQPTDPHKQALSRPPLDTPDHNHDHERNFDSLNSHDYAVQRAIAVIPGKSSGWFRKGRRDKINALVVAYNTLEVETAKAKSTSVGVQKLLTAIQKILTDAKLWLGAVIKATPEKAASIADWIVEEVEREETAKRGQLGEVQASEALDAAWNGASYNVLYTSPQFTSSISAGTNWLATPALAPIYEYHIIKNQLEASTLNAYKDIKKYCLNPSRDEALRIYHKYQMQRADVLNITGEGAGGTTAINLVRNAINTLEVDPTGAPPLDFGAIGTSVENVINELFVSFTSTEAYQKVTTAPAS